jgi:hypothetical protein
MGQSRAGRTPRLETKLGIHSGALAALMQAVPSRPSTTQCILCRSRVIREDLVADLSGTSAWHARQAYPLPRPAPEVGMLNET